MHFLQTPFQSLWPNLIYHNTKNRHKINIVKYFKLNIDNFLQKDSKDINPKVKKNKKFKALVAFAASVTHRHTQASDPLCTPSESNDEKIQRIFFRGQGYP